MNHFFYFARCVDGSLYAGYTIDILKRAEAHNSGKGAKYTASRLPVEIVYSENFSTKQAAMRREAEVKQWRKSRKEELISRF
jgi:putative endonuclease